MKRHYLPLSGTLGAPPKFTGIFLYGQPRRRPRGQRLPPRPRRLTRRASDESSSDREHRERSASSKAWSDRSSTEKEEEEEPRGHGGDCAARRLVSIRLPSRSFLPAISQPILQRLQRVRCALRALMMPISLSYPFTVPPWARHRDSRGYFCIQCE